MRKEKVVVLNDRGRELTFKIREMPATRLESFIIRAGLLLAGSGLLKSGGNPVSMDAGAALDAAGKAIAEGGLSALAQLDPAKVQPLLNELLGCCEHMVDGLGHPLTPETVDGVIEDIKTLFTLRKEALILNFDFFGAAGLFASPPEVEATAQSTSKPKISVR